MQLRPARLRHFPPGHLDGLAVGSGVHPKACPGERVRSGGGMGGLSGGEGRGTMTSLEESLQPQGRRVLRSLSSPAHVQDFLDPTPYSAEKFSRCPRRVIEDRKAHCFDGALFAAAALRRLGFPALIVDMHAVRYDDHLIALFRRAGCWGAVAKSNFVGLRYREPVYRSLRELAMSYFEDFYNPAGEKTLRPYPRPIRLAWFDRLDWETRDEGLETIARHTDRVPRIRLITPAIARGRSLPDDRSYRAGLQGVNPAGLYRGPMRGERSRGR